MDHKSKIVFFSTPGNTSRLTADLLDAIEKAEAVQVVTVEHHQTRLCRESPHLFTGKQQTQWKSEQWPQRGKRGRR